METEKAVEVKDPNKNYWDHLEDEDFTDPTPIQRVKRVFVVKTTTLVKQMVPLMKAVVTWIRENPGPSIFPIILLCLISLVSYLDDFKAEREGRKARRMEEVYKTYPALAKKNWATWRAQFLMHRRAACSHHDNFIKSSLVVGVLPWYHIKCQLSAGSEMPTKMITCDQSQCWFEKFNGKEKEKW